MRAVSYLFLILSLLVSMPACERQDAPPVPPTVIQTLPAETVPVPQTQPVLEPAVPDKSVFVPVEDYIPGIFVELKYATEDNFTGQKVYTSSNAYLRYGKAEKLAAVQADLQELGWSLKIWDAFRPVSAQYRLWEICPDVRYVANPETGFSTHSKGNTVDVTLVDSEGRELEMPTAFDDFSKKADRNYADCTAEAANNAEILEILMEKHGFSGYSREWWHFSDKDDYPVEAIFLSE